jgi:hypothetical protein
MALRVLAGQGTAFAFILVALAFLGLFQLGWRLGWRWASSRLLTADAQDSQSLDRGTLPAGKDLR